MDLGPSVQNVGMLCGLILQSFTQAFKAEAFCFGDYLVVQNLTH